MTIDLPPDLPKRRRLRLTAFDYTTAGAYFVTICTDGRRCILGNVEGEDIRLSPIGEIVSQLWSSLPTRWLGIDIDEFVVMPNHLHAVVLLGEGGPALPQLISRFKSFSTRTVRALPGESKTRLWQRSYHDHVVRDDSGLSRIREYIANNPMKWHLDRENPANVGRAARRAGREAGPYN